MSPYVIFALLVTGIGNVVGLDLCAIDCTHGNTFTADPVNCKNYYICYDFYDHSEYPFTCDGNQFFDIVSYSCKDSDYTCTPECEKCSFDCDVPVLDKRASTLDCGVYFTCSTSTWTTCPTATPYFNGDVCQVDQSNCCTCKSYCTQADAANHVLVPDYHDCTKYYLCLTAGIPDETTHGDCPSGSNFDPDMHDCAVNGPCIQPCASSSSVPAH